VNVHKRILTAATQHYCDSTHKTMSQPCAKTIYVYTRAPPTTKWQGHTPRQSHCSQRPAALTWPHLTIREEQMRPQPRFCSANGDAVFTYFWI